MGLFQKLIDKIEEADAKFAEEMRVKNEKELVEKERDYARPNIMDLPYTKIDPSVAESDSIKKSHNERKGFKEAFIECIKSGKAEYADVYMITAKKGQVHSVRGILDSSWDPDAMPKEIYRNFVKVADKDGVVLRQIVSCINEIRVPYETYKWEEATNPDKVEITEKSIHAYILHYFLEEREYYRIISDDELQNLGKVVRWIDMPNNIESYRDELLWWN